MDGTGYPSGISQETLSIHARMAVCDVFDAVTSNRAYKRSWSPGAALDWSITGHFDPRALLGAFPLGSLMLLSSQKLAVVIDEPTDAPTSPDVAIFRCAASGRDLPPASVSTHADAIVGVESAANWGLADFEPLREGLLAEFASA